MVAAFVLLTAALFAAPLAAFDARDLVLPPGFTITTYAEGVTDARQLAIGANGTVFAGSREAGLVSGRRDGRFLRYTVNFERLGGVIGYLLNDCCMAHPEICACAGQKQES